MIWFWMQWYQKKEDDGSYASRGWKSEDEKLSCGYSSFREKRASLEGFYDVKISKVDGQMACLFVDYLMVMVVLVLWSF